MSGSGRGGVHSKQHPHGLLEYSRRKKKENFESHMCTYTPALRKGTSGSGNCCYICGRDLGGMSILC